MNVDIKRKIISIDNYDINRTRFYSYLKFEKNVLKEVTVAVKSFNGKLHFKEVIKRTLCSDIVECRDIDFYYICGYVVDWKSEQKWQKFDSKLFNVSRYCVNPEVASKCFPYIDFTKIFSYNVWKCIEALKSYPPSEILIKLNLVRLIDSKSILKLLLNKNFRQWIYKNRDTVGKCDVKVIVKAYKQNKPLDFLQNEENYKKELRSRGLEGNIINLFSKDIFSLKKYLDKQKISVSYYRDYANACMQLNIDMSRNKNRCPDDFKRWHDIRIDEYALLKAENDKKINDEIFKKFKAVSLKFAGLQMNDQFNVIIAKNPADLVREGMYLHHCVGSMGYDKKMAKSETLIFFVRENANTPMVTLEYSIKQKKILQCYGEHNTKPNEKIIDFLNNKWLPFANKKLKEVI